LLSDDEKDFELFKLKLDYLLVARKEAFQDLDKTVLTFSSAGLAVSLTFMKDIVPITHLHYMPVLYASWGFPTLDNRNARFSCHGTESSRGGDRSDGEILFGRGRKCFFPTEQVLDGNDDIQLLIGGQLHTRTLANDYIRFYKP
jgi:hypothetical protein